MRIALLTPGTGTFYCGSCLRDHALCTALRDRGHDAVLVPLYLPFVLEEPDPAASGEVLLGGINMYLQYRSRWFGRLPRWLRHLLDRPSLLRFSARHADMTDAAAHAAMTVATLEGIDGRQHAEFEGLVRWMKEHQRPDVVILSNALLLGVAAPLRDALRVPVVCSLQGEVPFLDAFTDPARSRAWSMLRELAKDASRFVAVSRWYAEEIGPRLGLDPAKVAVVHNGLPASFFAEPDRAARPERPTLGFLARLAQDKGLPDLVRAFVELVRRGRVPGLRLHVAGSVMPGEGALLQGLRDELENAGLADRATFQADLAPSAKAEFLRSLSVLCVPALYGESFGLYLLEAMAYGVPVVQPSAAAFPEILESTGGGVLYDPAEPAALVDTLESLLLDPERIARLGTAGRAAVEQRFTAARMAEGVERVLLDATSPDRRRVAAEGRAVGGTAVGGGAPG